ncbi:FAD binding domain-containing protein [Leifsonia virtsii]|uniref:FAD binding domain-containing protein n=1 Tax=Leifsonia virtsii TaxID=3035915 RepID=A0ABT8IWN4_9MICO|nr:FAD binding domain-containing protein [Leifsonia virtsii]MDN4597222.1 FAD binding domain-containing protein [Leifsonia virtsii]
MDINTVDSFRRPTRPAELRLAEGETFLAGGSWLFSEPQPDVTGLVDLTALAWPAVESSAAGLRLAATCTLAELAALHDTGWTAEPLFRESCRALLGSFKVWNVATVGGNLCLALAAAPMAALTVALDASLEVWGPDGTVRTLDALDLIVGPGRTVLDHGDLLRAIDLPALALTGETASRKASLRPLGRSAAFVVGRRDADGRFTVVVTAATPHPYRFRFDGIPTAPELRATLDTIPEWYDDPHGSPDWRRAITLRLAEELRTELAEREGAR